MKRASCALKSRFSKWKLKEEPGLKEPQGSRNQKLAQDLLVCEGLELFCKDFCLSIEHTLSLLAKFWELMQLLDVQWFNQEDGGLQAHFWALRVGLGAALPVCTHLQRHLKAARKLRGQLRDRAEVFQARDKAWVEKEHYQRKLNELRSELSKRDRGGQTITAEQLERLQRNEAKNARAQDIYDDCHMQAQAYAAAKEGLKTVLREVVRTVTCGWFISVGAGVCRAVVDAESAQRGEAGAPVSSKSSTSPASLALPGWPLPPPDSLGSQCTVEEFDPANPFKTSWRCTVEIEREDSSDGGEEPSAAPNAGEEPAAESARKLAEGEDSSDGDEEPSVPNVPDVQPPAPSEAQYLEHLSDEELRQRLAERGLGLPTWCVDRSALVELVRTLGCSDPLLSPDVGRLSACARPDPGCQLPAPDLLLGSDPLLSPDVGRVSARARPDPGCQVPAPDLLLGSGPPLSPDVGQASACARPDPGCRVPAPELPLGSGPPLSPDVGQQASACARPDPGCRVPAPELLLGSGPPLSPDVGRASACARPDPSCRVPAPDLPLGSAPPLSPDVGRVSACARPDPGSLGHWAEAPEHGPLHGGALRDVSEGDLREMLVAAGLTVRGSLTRDQLEDFLLRSQT